MLRNFITIALRQFRRNFVYSLINITGLALGLAGSFVIGSWVWQELSYDQHFEDSERIYRVSVSFYNSGAFASGPEILNHTIREVAPEVEIATRLDKQSPIPVFVNKNQFEVEPFYTDSSFFKIFSYDFLVGNPEKALSGPSQVVIDEQLARQYFGTTDVLGKALEIGEEQELFIITGVVKHTDNPSHINARLWLPIQLENKTNWTSAQYYNYVRVSEGVNEQALQNRLALIKKEIVYPEISRDASYQDWVAMNIFDFHVVPLEDIHLEPDMAFEIQPGGNRANVYIFLIVASFLVFIAAINFINLSTARSIKRAKEVGVRKALGTARHNLITQFLAESIFLSLVAMLVGVGLAEVFLILFETFTDETLVAGIFKDISKMGWYILFGLMVGILAGIYPAFYLSRYKPADILRSSASQSPERQNLRNVLVIFQFTISIALIIG
ncbi:MAG: ABC transporter permease, partial [Fulvivirga sp.]|nr:ABC transporter permease [Fulvivirga sp.]